MKILTLLIMTYIYAENYYDCEGNCIIDSDNDGVCNEFEIIGCTDILASNYSIEATESDNSLCEYNSSCDCDYGSAMVIDQLCYIVNACSDPLPITFVLEIYILMNFVNMKIIHWDVLVKRLQIIIQM